MKLKIAPLSKKQHSDAVTCVCWTGIGGAGAGGAPSSSAGAGYFISASDDGTVCQWSSEGELIGQLIDTPDFGITDFHVNPTAPELLAAACSDGNLRLYVMAKPPAGSAALGGNVPPLLLREDKKVPASSIPGAAIISVRWSHDGTAIATGGEDGTVKVWSRAGMLRATLATTGKPVYSVRWGPDNSSLLFACGKDLTIIATQGTGVGVGGGADAGAASGVVLAGQSRSRATTLSWKAHNGVVLCADWCFATGRIVSGGEDCRYRVWDAAGRQLFASAPFETVITSLAWAPSGTTFLVGSYNTLRLCDEAGWSHSRHLIDGRGSLFGVAWTGDGTTFAAGTGSGAVVLGGLMEQAASWASWEVSVPETHKVAVFDAASGFSEEAEYRDPVVDVAVGHGHVVVATTTQVHAYPCAVLAAGSAGLSGGGTSVDLRQAPVSVLLAPRLFAVIDTVVGLSIYSYDGRHVTTPKIPGLRPEHLIAKGGVALTHDVLAVLDRGTGRTIRCFDSRSGRQVGTPITHAAAGAAGAGAGAAGAAASSSGARSFGGASIVSIALSQFALGGVGDRKLAFLDSAHDLYISSVVRPNPVKVASLVDAFAWADDGDVLVVVSEGGEVLTTHLFPHALTTDPSLERVARLTATRSDPASPVAGGLLGSLPTIVGFHAGRLEVKRGDGALVQVRLSVYAPQLYELAGEGRWEAAVRLCRFVRVPALWACLACMALQAKNLDVAEIALAASGAVDKLQYVVHAKGIPLPEVRNAELALYRHAWDEAEACLLQATPPLTYRAIKLNVRLGRWLRALELAASLPPGADHVDTVLSYRHEYLKALGRRETLEPFLQVASSRAAAAAAGAAGKAVAEEADAGDDTTGLAKAFSVEAVKAKKRGEKAKEVERARAAGLAVPPPGGGGGGGVPAGMGGGAPGGGFAAGPALTPAAGGGGGPAGYRYDGKNDDVPTVDL